MDPSGNPQQPPSYPTYPSYSTPGAPAAVAQPAPAPKKGGAGRAIAIVVVVLVVALGAVGYLRYNGPVSTVKSFVQDVFVNLDVSAAAKNVCADSASEFSSSIPQSSLDQIKAVGGKFDISGVQYSMANTNFISAAQVKLSGKITFSFQGQTQTVVDFSTATNGDNVLDVKASGLGWCISSPGNFTPGASK